MQFEKKANLKHFVCAAAERSIFSDMWADLWKFSVAPVGGGLICTKMWFLLGACWVGGLVVLLLFPSLGAKPSLFLFVCFGFWGVFRGGVFFLAWFCLFFSFFRVVLFLFKNYQQCPNYVHCKKRGSEKSAFLAIFWGFWFSQDRLFSRNSTRKPLNLIKSPIFTNTPCKSTCLYNAPSMHTV